MESNERFDEIMGCSKEAIARAYTCVKSGSVCPAGGNTYCPFDANEWCIHVTPLDWQKVLNEHERTEPCVNQKTV